MASEVQHIITLSLNKIMASRSRRGGVSLHRNLLVASVLLRAKDAYIAETVAKRKKDMDAEAVVPNLECPESPEEDQLSENMETDASSQPTNGLLQQEGKLIHIDSDVADDNTDKDYDNFDCDYGSNSDSITDSAEMYCDASKENVDPNVSSQCEFISRSCGRKRRYTELDSDELAYDDSKQIVNHQDSTTEDNGSCCKHLKVDSSDSCTVVNNANSFNYSMQSELSGHGYTCSLHRNSGENWDYNCDNCAKQSNLSSTEEHINCSQSVCTSLTSNEQIFTQQVNMAHTNLLIVTI